MHLGRKTSLKERLIIGQKKNENIHNKWETIGKQDKLT